jgi:hypothetical protein
VQISIGHTGSQKLVAALDPLSANFVQRGHVKAVRPNHGQVGVVGFAGGEVVPAQDRRDEGAKVAALSSIWPMMSRAGMTVTH